MSFVKAYFLGATVVLVAACGGSVFNKGGDGGDDGGSSSQGGSSSHAGTKSVGGKAGSSSSAGSVGTAGTSIGVGGSVGMGGAIGVAGGPNCFNVDCAYPVCDDGQMPITPAGQCCPVCPPPAPSCKGVSCEPIMACPMGYEQKRLPGACCEGCYATPGGVGCLEIACPPNNCPLGYVPGDAYGGCCYDCVPDPLFCNTTADCVIADRPRPCCGCPEAITQREYGQDVCWSAVDMPRMIPPECYPQFMCDAVCGACPPPGKPLCAEHRCIEMGLK